MKRYIWGMLALATAISLSSFMTFTKITTDTLVFKYDGTGGFTSVSNMESEANWDYEGTTEETLPCDGPTALKGCKIILDPTQLNIDQTPSTSQSLADVSSDMVVDAAKPLGQTYANVLSVTRFGYAGTVSNKIP